MIAIAAAAAGASLHHQAGAAELPNGTVLSKENIDRVKSDTFGGQTIANLLTEKQEWQIRNAGRTIQLGTARPIPIDPRWVAATNKYASQVKYDAKAREISGYQAGVPFPDISATDPDAGEKVMWNFFYGSPYPRDLHTDIYFVTINQKGYEATQRWVFSRITNRGRLGEDKPNIADSDIYTKTMLVAQEPQDIRGTGTFTVRYDVAGKLEDQWAYIKSARRIRRLSGNSWMDPVGSFDILNDDIYVYNARPSQYQKNKLLGKRWILAVTDFKQERNPSKAGTEAEFPQIDSKQQAPYWYNGQQYTPREVWVVECTPPAEHPYSKKLVYVDAQVPVVYTGEFYDKRGEFWRSVDFFYHVKVGEVSGIKYYTPGGGQFVDFNRKRTTHTLFPGVADRKGTSWDKYTPEALETLQ